MKISRGESKGLKANAHDPNQSVPTNFNMERRTLAGISIALVDPDQVEFMAWSKSGFLSNRLVVLVRGSP